MIFFNEKVSECFIIESIRQYVCIYYPIHTQVISISCKASDF